VTDGDDAAAGDDDPAADAEAGSRRHQRLVRHATPGPRNSLQSWTDAKHPLRIAVNYATIVAARHSPSLRLKNWLLRHVGVDVGTGVSWGLESTPDVFWPELITVEDDAIIGYDATILCHEFLQDEYRTGEVRVGERAMIGAGAVLLPGVEVGTDAQVAANSLVADDVPPGETWAGVPAEPVEGSDGGETAGERPDPASASTAGPDADAPAEDDD
jgi:maltose O-acetyltransferase